MQRWLSFLAPALMPLYRAVADQVAADMGEVVELRQGRGYAELGSGDYDFAWICGLPYVEVVDGLLAAVTPVAAPELSGARYGGRPIYYSDVIVGDSSRANDFAGLRGCRWAFNETGSHSGYLVTLHRLAVTGEGMGFFGEWLPLGYHEAAIRAVAAGEADASAIDSHVLEIVLGRMPELRSRLRVIDALGPSPIQPLVAGPHVPEQTRLAVREAALRVSEGEPGRTVLTGLGVNRLVAVDDAAYDPIRAMLQTVRLAGLWSARRPPGLALEE